MARNASGAANSIMNTPTIPAPGSEPTALKTLPRLSRELIIAGFHPVAVCDEAPIAYFAWRSDAEKYCTMEAERAGLVAALLKARAGLAAVPAIGSSSYEVTVMRYQTFIKPAVEAIDHALSGLPAASNHDENAK